jgi:Putative phage replication protein RstA
MIIQQPAIDWITLSEPLERGATGILRSFAEYFGSRKREGRRIGYDGYTYTFRAQTFFYGERTWKERDWGLLIASGESAHWVVSQIWETEEIGWDAVRCTRIDVQVTIPWPEYPFFLRHLVLTEGVKASVVHGLSEDDAWAETLYLGSRASPVMVRAYRKRVDDSGHDWMRCEVEYKREASRALFRELLLEQRVANWFGPVEERCLSLYEMIDPYMDDDPDRPIARKVEGNTFKWLSTTVANCVCRLLKDDDHREAMTELVSQWYEYSQACKRWESGV